MNILKWFKSNTNKFAVAVGVLLPILESQLPIIRQHMEGNHVYLYVAIATGIAFFRAITNKPLSQRMRDK